MASARPFRQSGRSLVAVVIGSLVVLGGAPTIAQEPSASPVASPTPLISPGSSCAPEASAAPSAPAATPDAGTAPSASPSLGACPPAMVVAVQAFDLGFRPTEITLPATGSTRLVLDNTGAVVHNLTVDALSIQIVASRGRSNEAVITDPAPGTYEFYCSVSGHKQAGMFGTLIVS